MRWEIGEYVVHQLLCGRDVAADGSNPLFVAAGQMANYVYLVEHVSAPKEALLVDAAWDVEGIYSYAESHGLQIVGAIYTHYHFDHVGGPLPKSMTRGKDVSLEGIATVLEHETPIYAGANDQQAMTRKNSLTVAGLGHEQTIPVGEGHVKVLWTPGHTPGSICVACVGSDGNVEAIVSGDTLFVGSVGRTDLPDSDVRQMLSSLLQLAKLPADTIVFPGHNYAEPPYSTIGQEAQSNPFMMQAKQLEGKISSSPTAARIAGDAVERNRLEGQEVADAGGSDSEQQGPRHCWACECCRRALPILLVATSKL